MARDDHERLGAWLAGRARGRAVAIVAHPDDEVLGCGALLSRLHEVEVVHVTDGAPRDGGDAQRHGFTSPAAYAAARAREAREALVMAGVAPGRMMSLGFIDQEVPFHLAEATARVRPAMAGAGIVLTHAFEGGHGDHDAVAYAVHRTWAALDAPRPLLVEMPFYHAGPDGWQRQVFLSQPGAGPERPLVLSEPERDLKNRMIAAHRSQADTLRGFAVDVERFRVAPPYDFTRRPHAGDLLYERHGWQLDWTTWVARVREADAAPAGGPA